ncbi:MAG: rhomboid family intramembrane serine protease, partial [Thermomicrobia bacterium]|nr:rhomboid family intramembrane serine protease [Thermomicrobia bacterium]
MFPIGDDNRDRLHRPVVTYLLIALNVAVFLYMLTLRGNDQNFFVAQWGVIPARFTHAAAFQAANPEFTSPRYLTLFTAMFIHGGWLHIGGNMLFLWVFGDNVEDAMGPGRFILFYLLVGLAGNFAHIYFNQSSLAPSIGASGAIAGVLGGYIVLKPRGRVRNVIWLGIILIPLVLPAWIVIGYWFVLQAFNGFVTLGANFRSGGASGSGVA